VLRATLKGLLAKKLRLVLTATSVVLGVGFVAGTFVLTDTMNSAFDELFATGAEVSDVTVRAESAFEPTATGPGSGGGTEGRTTIPEDLLATVEGVPGVARVSGDVQGYAQMVDPATDEVIGGFGPPTIGGNWSPTGASVLEIRTGSEPTEPTEVVIDAATARSFDLSTGERIRILFEGPPEEFTIVGTAGFGTADNLGGATLALFETSTAQRVLGKEGVFDSIGVVAEAGMSPAALGERIQAALPRGVEALTTTAVADEQSEALQEGLGFFRIALLAFAGIALFVGAFIIFNTFSIIVAQRTRELALFRALGASRRQVTGSVMIEALVVGLLASATGIVVGIGIALLLQILLGAFGIDLPTTSLQVRPRTIVVALVVGTLVTLVSSLLPARRAARVAPIQAMRDAQQTSVDAGFGRRLVVGIVVTALGAGALLLGLFGNQADAGSLIGLGAAVVFVGIAILAPLVARPLARGIGGPIRALSVPAKLGRENAMRNPRRTAATASALMIGLGLVAMVTILTASLKASFDAALADSLRADFTLTTTSFIPFSPDVATRVRELPEVGAVSEFRQGGFRVSGSDSFLTGVDPSTIEQVAELEIASGSSQALSGSDGVLVFSDLAEEKGWSTGDDVAAAFATAGRVDLPIVGIFGENRLVGGDFVVSLETYERYFTEQLDAFVMVTAAAGSTPADARLAIQGAVEDFPNIEVQDQAAFREQQAGFINQLLGLVTALLAMAILIALFGIVNTLSLSIFERTRELGLLRAVGMTRIQVKRMVRWESVIISILGAVFGIAIGVFFGWALQQALAPEGVTELEIPVPQLVSYLVIAGLAGVLTAVFPARRAARLDVLQAISYE
jgi:putative ABC transport system permease protein